VAKEPGTTRDNVTAKANYGGKDFWLVDTAGLKSAQDEFELSIQEQIGQATGSADVVLVVVDAEGQINDQDRKVAKIALKSRKKTILVANKADKAQKSDTDWRKLGIKKIIFTSATQKSGLEELLNTVISELPPAKIKEDTGVIKIGILGRPNVGKSSLFNSLGQKQQALVAAKSGTTRDINRVRARYHERELEILDTAGIRRSGKIEPGVEQFSVLRSLSAIEESEICLVVIDLTEPSVQLDQKIASLVKEAGKGLVIIVNKYDLATETNQRAKVTAQISSDFAFVPWAPLVFISSKTGLNVAKIFDLVLEIDEWRHQTVKTIKLNKWLRQAVDSHPPAGYKGTQPKLNYMVQESQTVLPSFKVFGSHTKMLHWSYKRYLEHSFRDQWPFNGTPIKFWFIENTNLD